MGVRGVRIKAKTVMTLTPRLRAQGVDDAWGVGWQGVHEVGGGRRRAAGDTSSSTSSSRSGTSVKDTLEKRRMQVQEGDGE